MKGYVVGFRFGYGSKTKKKNLFMESPSIQMKSEGKGMPLGLNLDMGLKL